MTRGFTHRYNQLLGTLRALAERIDSVETLEKAAVILQHHYPELRRGQALSNLFYRAARAPVSQTVDPYYDDSKIGDFLEFARKHF